MLILSCRARASTECAKQLPDPFFPSTLVVPTRHPTSGTRQEQGFTPAKTIVVVTLCRAGIRQE